MLFETVGIILMSMCVGFFAGWWLREYTKKPKLAGALIASNDKKRDAIAAGTADKKLRERLNEQLEDKLEMRRYVSDCISCQICPVCLSPIKLAGEGRLPYFKCTNQLCGWRQFDPEVNP